MRNRMLLLVLFFIMFIGIAVFIHKQQQLVNEEISNMSSVTPQKAQPVQKVKRVSKAKPYVIDPNNDPLAPVAKVQVQEQRTPSKTTQPKEKYYEMSLDSPILTQ